MSVTVLRDLLSNLISPRNRNDRAAAAAENSHAAPRVSAGEFPEHIGLIAGNGPFPKVFVQEAKAHGCRITAVCHIDETDPELEALVDRAVWIRVGELGRIIRTFKDARVSHAAMAGGINRIKHFGDVKLDARGAALMLRLRSTKDDVIMRGIAGEIEGEGIPVIECTRFLKKCLTPLGVLTKSAPSEDEQRDIAVGIEALKAMSAQDIGQLVVVREGAIVAVEAVEGTNLAIRRGGELGGKGSVVVKFAKCTQDMRFDVPTVGVRTIEIMSEVKARVLALESGRTLLLEGEKVIALADKNKIAIIGCPALIAAE